MALGMMLLVLSPPASAHDRQLVGQYSLTIGWGDEPAFTGSKNFVSVAVADAAGTPVTDLNGSLGVEVSFGDERITLALQPARQRPGEFRAWLIPTRSGTYAFHITGTVKGQTIDARSTCSDRTFNCVTDVSDIQFPAKDPSAAQLAEGVSRALPRAERAVDRADGARTIAIAAIAVALLAFATTLGFRLRGGRKAS